MDPVLTIFFIVILIISVVIHELSHGFAADALGDPTPRLAGRLTLNPLKHLDLWGSFIVPFFLVITGVPFIIGWAKPVPFNPFNLKLKRWGGAIVAVAGPLSNLIIALVFGLLLRFIPALDPSISLVGEIFGVIVLLNILLMLFNLIPVPPLDGHHILFALLGKRGYRAQQFLRRYAFFGLILVIVFLWRFIAPAIIFLYTILVGDTPPLL